MSKLEKCLVVFEVGNTGLRVTVRSKLTGRVAGFDMLGEAQGIARFEFDEVPTLISQEAPVPTPSPTPETTPEPKPAGWAYRQAVQNAVEGIPDEPRETAPAPKKRGRPPKVRALDSGTVTADSSTVDEESDWRPQDV